jgi:hypothetical protein
VDLISLILATFLVVSNRDCPFSQFSTKLVYYKNLPFVVKRFLQSISRAQPPDPDPGSLTLHHSV